MIDESTIAAIATPPGTGGISIIKISGPKAVEIAASIFKTPRHQAPHSASSPSFHSHRLYYGHIVDPADGSLVDEVLLSIMKAPRSYTREDVVEINSHGSAAGVYRIMDLVLRAGARPAEPGEFTRRAFLNGRIDLTQAEAVIDLINARSVRGMAVCAAQLNGALSRELRKVKDDCIGVLARIEAGIDFPDQIEEVDGAQLAQEIRAQVLRTLKRLVALGMEGRPLREGLRVSIVGRPNVGKSSLMNRLLSKDRSIVAQFPGTTRDAIEDTVIVQGVPVSLWDTAGIQDSEDPVEGMGIQRTWEQCERADLIIFVLESQKPVSRDDDRIFSKIRFKKVICVFNKTDLIERGASLPELPAGWNGVKPIFLSALTGQGLDELFKALADAVRPGSLESKQSEIIPNVRQRLVLEKCVEAAESSVLLLEAGGKEELAALHIRELIESIDEIFGTRIKPDLLEGIFNRFCIGK